MRAQTLSQEMSNFIENERSRNYETDDDLFWKDDQGTFDSSTKVDFDEILGPEIGY